MPTKVHGGQDAIQERKAAKVYLRTGQKGKEVGQEVHPSLEEKVVPDNEFSNDLEYMPSMDYAYSKSLQLGHKEEKIQFFHPKYENPPNGVLQRHTDSELSGEDKSEVDNRTGEVDSG